MRRFRHTFTVNCDIDTVWKFYTDIKHLEVITPKDMQFRIVKANQVLTQGSEVYLSGKLMTKSAWHSKITYLKPYTYVDEMLSGRFKTWKHLHKFQKIDDNSTEVIDEIDFELPYGFLGRMLEGYVYNRLQEVFIHRKAATIKALETTDTL